MSKAHHAIEADAERELITEMRAEGLLTFHIDVANIPGFHDILAIGRLASLVEVKFHRPGQSAKLQDIMEPSQPVFMSALEDRCFDNSFLCVFDGEHYSLYKTDGMLSHSMDGHSYHELYPVLQCVVAKTIAQYIKVRCHGL